MGKIEIGLEIPIRGKAKLISNPENITKATLKPTEYSRLSIMPTLWILRILRMRIPGMKVRKTKPAICLKPGISKPRPPSPTKPSMASRMANDKRKHFLISQSLGEIIRVVSLSLVNNSQIVTPNEKCIRNAVYFHRLRG